MGLSSIWINSLGPDIVCSLWINVEDLYYIMDTDANKTGETRIRISTKSTDYLKYTISFLLSLWVGKKPQLTASTGHVPSVAFPSLWDLVCQSVRDCQSTNSLGN